MMQHQSLRWSFCFSLIAAFALTLAATPSVAQSDEVVIEVNGETVVESELEKRVDLMLQRMRSRYGDQIEEQDDEMRERIRQQTIDQTVEELLLKTTARESDVSVGEDEVQEAVESQKSQFQDEEQFQQALKNNDLTPEEFRQQVEENLLVQKFLKQEIGKVTVSEEEAREYFSENQQRFEGESFEENEGRIRRILRQQKQQDEHRKLLKELREDGEVDVRV